MAKTYLCIVCGKEFEPIRLAQQYCSKKCRNRADKNDRRFSGVRDYVLGRDGFKCAQCGANSSLIVHHKDWIRTNNDPSNLLTLCRSCHRKEHFEVTVKDETKKCFICDEAFNPGETRRKTQILCRRLSCKKEYKKRKKRKPHEEKKCMVCGELFMQKHSRHLTCGAKCSKTLMDRGKSRRYLRLRDELLEKQKRYYREHTEERKAYTKRWAAERKLQKQQLISG